MEVEPVDDNSDSSSDNTGESEIKSESGSDDVDDIALSALSINDTLPAAPASTPVTSSSGQAPQMTIPTLPSPSAVKCRESTPTDPTRGRRAPNRYVYPTDMPTTFPRGAGPELTRQRRRSPVAPVKRRRDREDGEKTEDGW